MIAGLGKNAKKLGLVAVFAALMLSLLVGLGVQTASAGSVTISDNAGIINSTDESNLRNKAASLPYNVKILTTNNYTSRDQFISRVRSEVPSSGIVLGVNNNASLKTTYVEATNNIGVSASEATAIAQAANSYFGRGDFVGGINAMLDSSRGFASVSNSGPISSTPSRSSGGGFGSIVGCLVIGVIALVALSVFGFGRRRQAQQNNYPGPGFNGPGYGPGQGPGYGPGYGNPGYGPGYGQGYGPGYNQGGGMGALGGGAIGAGLGGLVGYELGRQSGQNQGGGGYVSNPGSFDNSGTSGGGSDWGTTSNDSGSSDWGGGGGSTDFGSSSSFDAGGGGDWGGGGGGGGGDSGGGGGGDSW